MREQWAQISGMPFMLKGVCRVDDALTGRRRRGARRSRCPTTAATTSTAPRPRSGCCKPVSDAVGEQIEVLLDGGIRRGSDVVKALALGARAVMIGRAYLWGLAANGQTGVENVLDILRGGIDSALLGMGLSSIDELHRRPLCHPRRLPPRPRCSTRSARRNSRPSMSPRRRRRSREQGPGRVEVPGRCPKGAGAGAGRFDRAARSAPAARHGHGHRRRRRPAGGRPARSPNVVWRRRSPTAPAASTRVSPGTSSIGSGGPAPGDRRAHPLDADVVLDGSSSSTPTAETSPP